MLGVNAPSAFPTSPPAPGRFQPQSAPAGAPPIARADEERVSPGHGRAARWTALARVASRAVRARTRTHTGERCRRPSKKRLRVALLHRLDIQGFGTDKHAAIKVDFAYAHCSYTCWIWCNFAGSGGIAKARGFVYSSVVRSSICNRGLRVVLLQRLDIPRFRDAQGCSHQSEFCNSKLHL